MNDLISRQDAVSRIADLLLLELQGKRIPTWDEVHNAMQDLPSANQWIPCSERLPKENGFYLCSTKDCITILEFSGGNPHFYERPSFISDVLGQCNFYVEAWMPLPQPWKGENDEHTD